MPFDAITVTRRLWAAVLVSNSLWVGFVAGAAAGSRLIIAPDAGLEGGASLLWYGLAGAVIAAGAAVACIATQPPRRVRSLAVVALVIAAGLASYIAHRATSTSESRPPSPPSRARAM